MTSSPQLLQDLHCAGWEQISLSSKDTELTQDEIVAHNEYGVRSGCWKDPSKVKTKTKK